MRRFKYKFRRFNKIFQILGFALSAIGLIIILKTIPTQLMLFFLGLVLTFLGWFFFIM